MPTVRETLDNLEKKLVAKIQRLRADLVPLEGNLADVRRAKNALTKVEEPVSTVMGPSAPPKPTESPYRHLTMKELAKKALKEQFPNGATANQLLEHFVNAWGRTDIIRTSLSPQLSRLKRDREIKLRGTVWYLPDPEKDEAPTEDQSEGASKAGEGDASPVESRSVQRDIFG